MLNMFGEEKHIKVLIAQLYYKYFLIIITCSTQEIQKTRLIIQKEAR